MAFSEEQILAIGDAIGHDADVIADRLAIYSDSITPAVELRVIDLLDQYETARTAVLTGVSVEPKEANFGARVDPMAALRILRRDIANQLFMVDLIGFEGQTAMLRG